MHVVLMKEMSVDGSQKYIACFSFVISVKSAIAVHGQCFSLCIS